jgi:hypothetical protein
MSARIFGRAARGAALIAFAAITFGAPAQQATDAVAPFLGTWSGVFTTQDNEFWGAEDMICFPGCSRATRAWAIKTLSDPANDRMPFGAIFGQSGGIAERDIQAILTPAGTLVQQANKPETDHKLYCQPYGYVREVVNPLPMRITRDGDDLIFQYEEWSLLRRVHMTEREHPKNRTPSLFGHAIGRVENGALIIETANVVPDWISDATHAGHSDQLTGVERYTVRDKPRRLELEFTIRDPVMLTQPYVLLKTWLLTPDVQLVKDECANFPGLVLDKR